MIDVAVEAASWVLLLAGGFFYVVGTFGMLRMPDLFTRMHASSVCDTFGAGLLLLGMMMQAGFTLVAVKLVVILLLLFFTGPVATHALARAAMHAGVKPQLAEAPNPAAREKTSSKP